VIFLDIIFILPVVVLLSIVAGVFSKLNSVSFSIILIPGLLGFSDFISFSSSDVLLILIASSLTASIPLSVLYFIKVAKQNFEMSSVWAKIVTKIALLSILFSQILGVIPPLYSQYMYWFTLLLLTLGLAYNVISNGLKNTSGVSSKAQSPLLYYSVLMSVFIGAIGSEWRGVFAGHDKGGDKLGGFAFLSVFIALPACLGFMFPGLPVPLIEQNPALSGWMLGYICWPLSIVIFVSATLGQFMVRQHKNAVDVVWLNYILIIYLIASALRMIIP